MLFLGAGASKVFGLKTLQDLTDDLVKKLRNKGYNEIDEIIIALKKFGLTPDFENIYSTIDALADPYIGIKKSGGFTAYIASKGNFQFGKRSEYAEFLEDFRELIYNECSIEQGVIGVKKQVFDTLFKTLQGTMEYRILTSKTGTTDNASIDIGNTIVTTNYDMAVELYHNIIEMELADGFKKGPNVFVEELNFNEYGIKRHRRWLIKLHGSIWMYKQANKIIRTINAPDALPIKISVGDQMMIYPVGEKPILREPYYSFYSIFKEQPWSVLVAIGYSFRDEPVNLAILERLRAMDKPKPKLIVINPEAEKVVENLGLSDKELRQRIIRINMPFELENIDDLVENIKMALKVDSWNRYKERALKEGLLNDGKAQGKQQSKNSRYKRL